MAEVHKIQLRIEARCDALIHFLNQSEFNL